MADKVTYQSSGVDIAAGDDAVRQIATLVKRTHGPQVLSGIGHFGGLFQPDFSALKQPVLVSSADGVGTKLRVAILAGRHDGIGEDLVNHCVNDILVMGARPLFFLDYIAAGKLRPAVVAQIVSGMVRGCTQAGMALVGGETAEMPGLYHGDDYDVAGFIVGMVDRASIIDGSKIAVGDKVIGLAANGLHTNGYSLARKVIFDLKGHQLDDQVPALGSTIGDALLAVHTNYAPAVTPLLTNAALHGMAHITGGGIPGNLIRILPPHRRARLLHGSWEAPPIFSYLAIAGDLDHDDIFSAFNMGIGYILVVAPEAEAEILAALRQHHRAWTIGEISDGERGVEFS